ncbi:hypothetical protein RE6C_01444 [Rhodopirellula europaea 6C]|uniref:Uncharacterized protein n=1 Tax=Rhodopirellula europaea 6C TaxID=1263867 RepID=M2B7V8_9BACT|nr:hypothetical protein RE6C_01444 [Rhodopirellula europaea 6C]
MAKFENGLGAKEESRCSSAWALDSAARSLRMGAITSDRAF